MATEDTTADPRISPATIVSSLAASMPGLDVAELLDSMDDGDPSGIREGQVPEGDPRDEPLELPADYLEELGRDLATKCELFDQAMIVRRRREQEILDNYDMIVADDSGGLDPESSRLASEETQTNVDQVAARIVSSTMSVKPLARVQPLEGLGEEAVGDAEAAENVLNNYAAYEMDLISELPVALHHTTKLGTFVVRLGWEVDERRYAHYDHGGERVEDVVEEGRVSWQPIENHNAVIWPLAIVNWQRDYEMVGHRSHYTRLSFRARLEGLGLGEEEIEELVAGSAEEPDEAARSAARREGVEVGQVEDEEEVYKLTELWLCHQMPTGEGGALRRERVHLILHEQSRRIVAGPWLNRRASGNHPYFPLRYKLKGRFAWGSGVGEECLWVHSIDSTLRTLKVDNLFAGAFFVHLIRSGSMLDRLWDRLSPGQNVPVDNPKEDFHTAKLGGEAPEINEAISENKMRGQAVVGLPPVLSGRGDPTMKSGAGTGSTIALIENAQTKFDYVGQRVRLDLSAIYMEILDILADNAPEGVTVHYASKDDSAVLRAMSWRPPRERLRESFKVTVQAPSVSSSNEARKMSYLALYSFSLEHARFWMEAALPSLREENPEAARRSFYELLRWLSELAERVTRYHDVPGIDELVPDVPEPEPTDAVIAQLQAQLQQAQAQLQQLQQPQQPPGPAPGQPGPMPPGGMA